MFKRLPFEALVWLTGLILLASADAASGHFSVCIFKNAGFTFCPGCGLGRSITQLFNGDVLESLRTHPLGVGAVVILTVRIVNLTKLYFQNYGKSY